jgi:hypothetical protein
MTAKNWHAARKSDLSGCPEGEKVAWLENGRILPVYMWENDGPVPDTEKTRGRAPWGIERFFF